MAHKSGRGKPPFGSSKIILAGLSLIGVQTGTRSMTPPRPADPHTIWLATTFGKVMRYS
ncbi:uncharacterized protein CCOS01_06428 [Colletotrichum costaricense]|uniref:Uncharacterized protein n=2 Tax=Colletotrichum acutatum species complex TaxID=2707335 RepID=A0AAI9YY38_9PEZI|nr:uncharacterized protein CCOS01_06428 [Colletotrichum costaricense]XP_060376108.1 uncharacterized protein CTAM01_13270 [Colletotrichum tamarilloi]KAK1483650.1 hypothetical protein CTAM01_13270 [Colletotrichum tamarilloi]KAK1528594.1 hypothetical protein CCOS01_06428 [Colletotrichum costaricense]